jgi:SAM-dependent methyltransferase
VDYNGSTTSVVAAMLRCDACGSVFPDRFPADSDLPSAYEGYYTRHGEPAPRRPIWKRLLNGTRSDYLRRATPRRTRRLLDFGCGSGAFLTALAGAEPAIALFGSDAFRPMAECRGFQWVEPEELEDVPPFDWITLAHVLEHVPDPERLLARLTGRLDGDSGGIWIATPNADSFLLAAAGRFARDLDFPRHRIVFSRFDLERLVSRCGLLSEPLSPPRLNAALNALSTVGNILRDRSGGPAERALAIVSTILALIGHVVKPAQGRLRTSPELVMICRPSN